MAQPEYLGIRVNTSVHSLKQIFQSNSTLDSLVSYRRFLYSAVPIKKKKTTILPIEIILF